MKTRYTLLYILTLLLSVFSVQTANAQTVQDALYIFRNDGQFNAFFFGDINRIEYSKIDTLGVEQDDYVVQEVYALDTLYRIPLNAIDSIAFVTPEKKYKADVFRPDKSIADYIVASDSINWIRLASNTPSTMIPKVGDKLFIEEESKYIPDGFVGLVTSVDQATNGYTIMTSELSPTDVFERLIVKAAGATPLPDNARRRGLFDGTEMSYTQEEPIELPTMSGSIAFQESYVLTPDGGPVDISVDGTGALTYSYTPRVQFRAFLFIDPALGIQYDQNVVFQNTTSWDLSFTGSMTGNVDIPLKGIDKKVGDMKVSANCGLFLNAQITGLTVGATWQNENVGRDYLVYSNRDLSGLETNPSNIVPVHKQNITHLRDTTTFTVSTQGKYSFSAGAYAKLEGSLKFPFNKKEIKAKVGVRLEVGARLNFDAPIWTPSAAAETLADLLSTTSIYQMLNKETNITASIYGKFSLYGQLNNWARTFPAELTLAKTNLYGLVPDITGINASYDDIERLYRIKFTSPIRRDVLFGIQTGFTFFDQDKKQIDDWDGGFHFRESQGTSYSHVFTTLDPIKDEEKTYTAYPYIKYLGYPILVDKSVDVTVDPARIDIEQREVFVGRDGGSLDISVKPNMANVECTSNEKWLSFVWLDHKNELAIYWDEMPKDTNDRKATILLQGKNSKTGELIIEDSVVVVQHEDLLEFTPKSIEAEANGGTYTVNITKTNLTDLSVSTESDFCTATLSDNVITVTVKPNTSTEARSASIVIKGKNAADKEVSDFIRISQASGSEVNPGEVSVAALQFLKSIDWICASYNATWYNQYGESRSYTYHSDTWTWNGRPDQYDAQDTIMIEEIKDPESPHVGKYKIIARQNAIGTYWYPDKKQFYYLEFIVDPNTNGAVTDIYMNSEVRWSSGSFQKMSYTQKNVPYKETTMYGDGVTDNSRMVEWSGSQEKGTLIDGNSSFTLEYDTPFDNECGYEFGDCDFCLIRIAFHNTIETPDDE